MALSAGAVRVDFIADGSGFYRVSGDVLNRTQRLQRGMIRAARAIRRHWKAVAVAFAGIAVGIGAAIRKSAEYSSTIVEVGRTTGFATRELENLRRLFQGDGIGIAMTDRMLRDFSVRLGQAQRGMGTYAKAFEELGVQVTNTDGTLRRNREVFGDVASALGRMTDQARASSLAYDVLGRNGRDAVPVFQQYIGTFDEAARHAGRFVTVTDEMREEGKELWQAITELKDNIWDLAERVLVQYNSRITDAINNFNIWISGIKGSDVELNKLAAAILNVADNIGTASSMVAGSAIGGMLGTGLAVSGAAAGAGVVSLGLGGSALGPVGIVVGALAGLGLYALSKDEITDLISQLTSGSATNQRLTALTERQNELLSSDFMTAADVKEYDLIVTEIAEIRADAIRYRKEALDDFSKRVQLRNLPDIPEDNRTAMQKYLDAGGSASAWTERRARRELLEHRRYSAMGLDPQMAFGGRPGTNMRILMGSMADALIDTLLGSGRRAGAPNPNAIMDDLGISRTLTKPPVAIAIMDDHSLYRFLPKHGRGEFDTLGTPGIMDDNSPWAFIRRGTPRDPWKEQADIYEMMVKNAKIMAMNERKWQAQRIAFREADLRSVEELYRIQEMAEKKWQAQRTAFREADTKSLESLNQRGLMDVGVREGPHRVPLWRLTQAKPIDDNSPFANIPEREDPFFARWQREMRDYYTGQERVMEAMKEQMKNAVGQTNELRAAFDRLGDSIIDNMDNAGDALRAFARELVKIGIQRHLLNPIGNYLFGPEDGGDGGLLGSVFGDIFPAAGAGAGIAAGASMAAPQVMDFSTPANAKSLNRLPAGIGSSVKISYNIQSSDGPGVRAALAEATPGIVKMAESSVADKANRPGHYRQQIRGGF